MYAHDSVLPAAALKGTEEGSVGLEVVFEVVA